MKSSQLNENLRAALAVQSSCLLAEHVQNKTFNCLPFQGQYSFTVSEWAYGVTFNQ